MDNNFEIINQEAFDKLDAQSQEKALEQISNTVADGMEAVFSKEENKEIMKKISESDNPEETLKEEIETKVQELQFEKDEDNVEVEVKDNKDKEELMKLFKGEENNPQNKGIDKDKNRRPDIFDAAATLKDDIQALKNGGVDKNGNKVSKFNVGMDILGVLFADINPKHFDPLSVSLKDFKDAKANGNKVDIARSFIKVMTARVDFVTERKPAEVEVKPISSEKTEKVDEVKENKIFDIKESIREDGLVVDKEKISKVELDKTTNPAVGFYAGFDMKRDSFEKDGMNIWSSDRPDNKTSVFEGKTVSVKIPSTRMVELNKNMYIVSPFGKVEASFINNKDSVVDVGNTIKSLDCSNGKFNSTNFENLAKNEGMSVEAYKEKIETESMSKYNDKVSQIESKHATYMEKNSVPDAENVVYRYGYSVNTINELEGKVDAQIEKVNTEIDRDKVPTKEQYEKLEKLEETKEKLENLKEKFESSLEKAKDYNEKVNKTLENYKSNIEFQKSDKFSVKEKFENNMLVEKNAVAKTTNEFFGITMADGNELDKIEEEVKDFEKDLENSKQDVEVKETPEIDEKDIDNSDKNEENIENPQEETVVQDVEQDNEKPQDVEQDNEKTQDIEVEKDEKPQDIETEINENIEIEKDKNIETTGYEIDYNPELDYTKPEVIEAIRNSGIMEMPLDKLGNELTDADEKEFLEIKEKYGTDKEIYKRYDIEKEYLSDCRESSIQSNQIDYYKDITSTEKNDTEKKFEEVSDKIKVINDDIKEGNVSKEDVKSELKELKTEKGNLSTKMDTLQVIEDKLNSGIDKGTKIEMAESLFKEIKVEANKETFEQKCEAINKNKDFRNQIQDLYKNIMSRIDRDCVGAKKGLNTNISMLSSFFEEIDKFIPTKETDNAETRQLYAEMVVTTKNLQTETREYISKFDDKLDTYIKLDASESSSSTTKIGNIRELYEEGKLDEIRFSDNNKETLTKIIEEKILAGVEGFENERNTYVADKDFYYKDSDEISLMTRDTKYVDERYKTDYSEFKENYQTKIEEKYGVKLDIPDNLESVSEVTHYTYQNTDLSVCEVHETIQEAAETVTDEKDRKEISSSVSKYISSRYCTDYFSKEDYLIMFAIEDEEVKDLTLEEVGITEEEFKEYLDYRERLENGEFDDLEENDDYDEYDDYNDVYSDYDGYEDFEKDDNNYNDSNDDNNDDFEKDDNNYNDYDGYGDLEKDKNDFEKGYDDDYSDVDIGIGIEDIIS